jgi:type IV secretory pathway VirB2 component (pilin)
MSLIIVLLIVLLVIAVIGGPWSHGNLGWSPVGIILLVLLILFLTGNLGHLKL